MPVFYYVCILLVRQAVYNFKTVLSDCVFELYESR
jgi:hypothetical protein